MKKKRQHLDACRRQLPLLAEVLLDSVADLFLEQGGLVGALGLAGTDLDAVLEANRLIGGADFVDDEGGVFRPVGLVLEAIPWVEQVGFLPHRAVCHPLMQGNLRLDRLLGGSHLLQPQEHLVVVVLLDHGCNLDLFDQRLPVRLKRGQAVHQVVRVAVCGAVAQGE